MTGARAKLWTCIGTTVVLSFASARADAWSQSGHRITGQIAASLLSEPARRQIRSLLGNDDLSGVATLLDDRREQFEQDHAGSTRWHYENRSVCGTQASCPRGDCVTRQIDNFTNVLRDRRASREQRIEAVVVLVHLIGDLHQPLHLADNGDRGGNDLLVVLPNESEPRKLHEVWDYSFVRGATKRRSVGNFAAALSLKYADRFAVWREGTIESWANETHALAIDAYRALPGFACEARRNSAPVMLTKQYIDASEAVVAEQLAKAGVRIAQVLNSVLI